MSQSNFSKTFPKPISGENDILAEVEESIDWQNKKEGYLAALKYAKKIIHNDTGEDDIIGYVSPAEKIEQEIEAIEKE